MDNIRIVLWLALLTLIWFAYGAWVTDYAEPPAETDVPASTQTLDDTADGEPLPQIDTGGTVTQSAPDTAVSGSSAPERSVHVVTDVLDVVIDLDGGDLVRAELLQYPVDKEEPDVIVRLLDYLPGDRWVFQTGLLTEADDAEPNHQASFTSESDRYTLAEGADELQVVLRWSDGQGIGARKIYTFRRGLYEIDLDIELQNDTADAWQGTPYTRMVRRHVPRDRAFLDVDSYSYTGPALYDGSGFSKLDFDDLAEEPMAEQINDGWYASIQHHFVAAAIPPTDQTFRFTAETSGERYLLTAVRSDLVEVAPGSTQTFPVRLFVGPKLQDQLTAVHEKLDLAVDYGVLTFLAVLLFWLLDFVHTYVGNWGWAIILVTLLIKLTFYPLTATSGRSMAKMRKLAPKMKSLQERYKDDRQALSQAMMQLYKKEKVNPAAGCLPILIQMPFFFAFYWVLIESVEMRQAPFMLWVDDLSKRDPFFVLPLLMMAAMVFQTRLNPAPPDPVQARIMQIMPIAFAAFMAFFPSGLVLYWLTNTALSILQQWRINKVVAAENA